MVTWSTENVESDFSLLDKVFKDYCHNLSECKAMAALCGAGCSVSLLSLGSRG